MTPPYATTVIGSWFDAFDPNARGTVTIQPGAQLPGSGQIMTAAAITVGMSNGAISVPIRLPTNTGVLLVITEAPYGAQPIAPYGVIAYPARTVAATALAGVTTIADTAIQATDAGAPIAGAGIPIPAYVGNVLPGVSFQLSDFYNNPLVTSAPVTQIQVNVVDLARAGRLEL